MTSARWRAAECIGLPVEHFLHGAEAMGAPAAGRENWAGLLRVSLPLASSLGVPVLVGSDGLAHGRIADEMMAMVRHGFGIEQTIDAATYTARKVLGLPGLEAGSPADFVLWERDPRTQLDVLGDPVAVIAAGRRVDLETPLPAPATGIPTRERYAQAAARDTCALGMHPE